MPIKRLTVLATLVSISFACSLLQAKDIPAPTRSATAGSALAHIAPNPLPAMSILNPVPMLTQSVLPSENTLPSLASPAAGDAVGTEVIDVGATDSRHGDEGTQAVAANQGVTDLRKALIGMAMKLRNIRYVRGGHDPATGFDCSGFVRYVFAHAIGLNLPRNSAAQFLAGMKVKRVDMEPGDLVFFHTHGKRRISHVGIYISDGRFIHSPTSGKSVEISSLDQSYWAKRFAGAKRPEGIAFALDKG